MRNENTFHSGELAVQERAGGQLAARRNAGAVDDRIPGSALRFIEQQPMAVAGSLDDQGRVWASLLFGTPSFLRARDDRTLVLAAAETHTAEGDPLLENLQNRPEIGLLLIELATRRRLRINGRARLDSDSNWLVEVERAYPNCPKYIQRRHWQLHDAKPAPSERTFRQGEQLTLPQQAWIARTDTFFVASAHPEQGPDASHRGGRPGFVQVLSPHRLRIPDFSGNNMFNTLGNFAEYPQAGLVFLDFERGRILQLTGRAELIWDAPDERGETGGTARFWEFEIQAWRESASPMPLDWDFIDYSPYSPAPATASDSRLSLQVESAWLETGRIKAFQLRAADGDSLPPFEPGAHLPVRVRDRSGNWVERYYSLLSDPADRSHYRIGVLAEPNGRGGSLYLHEQVQAGDVLQVRPPANAFPMETDAEHSILLAGGIGITPLLSMLHTLQAVGKSYELHYKARHTADLAFRQAIEDLAGAHAHFYASAEPGAPELDLWALLNTPRPNTHVYVCGPRPMIVAVRELAETHGWASEQIHFESFGRAASPHDRDLNVRLARSDREIQVPAGRSILDTLLESGVEVPHDCRRGECSLCATRLLAGEPDHRDLCLSTDQRAESMCVCVSRAHSDSLTFDL